MSAGAKDRVAGGWLERAIEGRRSVRLFRADPIEIAEAIDLIRAALWAPSPHNAQPWRFTVIADPLVKETLADAMAGRLEDELEADGVDAATITRQTSRSRSRISTAPLLLLCSLVDDGLVPYPDARRSDLEWKMAVQSVGAVLQSLFLLASEHGIGTCWMAAPMYCPDVVRSVLALPDVFVPQALCLMGYPDGPGKVRPRRPISEVVDVR